MGDASEGVNGIFYISLFTLFCTGITLSIKYCYKSKCKSLECGCIKVIRDVDVEKQEDLNGIIKTNSEEKFKL